MNSGYQHLKDQFLLDKKITYLNFGSFGACPRPVFEEYQRWQEVLESEPVQFMTVTGPAYLQESRAGLAKYIQCNSDDIVFVTNPGYAINIVARSLALRQNDEILATDIEYGACDRIWRFCCQKAGAVYVRQPVSLPLVSAETFVEEFFRGFTSRTRAVFISQITSATGLILPVKEICKEAKRRGVLTIVDGAHVPGQVDLDLSSLEADVYTGACHKWMMTPKGCSFLFVKREWQDMMDPLVVSWGYESQFPSSSRFLDYHQMQGTRDFSAFLTVPAAIRFMNENNWQQVASHYRRMTLDNARRFCDLLECEPLAPLSEEFFGQMFSLRVSTEEPEELQKHLFSKYQIEVPVMRQDEKIYLRYSLNAFNAQGDLDRLYEALSEIRSEKRWLD